MLNIKTKIKAPHAHPELTFYGKMQIAFYDILISLNTLFAMILKKYGAIVYTKILPHR